MLLDSNQVAHMLRGLQINKQKVFKGLEVLLLMKRDDELSDINLDSHLTTQEKIAEEVLCNNRYTAAIENAQEIIFGKR